MSSQRPKKITVDIGFATIVAACIAATVALIVHFTNPDIASDESSNNSVKKSSENISNTSETENFPTTDSLENDEYPSNPESPPEPAPTASSNPPATSTTPKTTPPTSTTPKTTPPTTSTSINDPNEPPPEENVLFKNDNGKVKLFNSYSGEACIYKKYINQNQVGIILPSEDRKICGWDILLLYDDTVKFSIHIESISNGNNINNRFKGSLWSVEEISDKNLYRYEGKVTVETEQNDDLLISFSASGIPIDLRNATSIDIINCYYPDSYTETQDSFS